MAAQTWQSFKEDGNQHYKAGQFLKAAAAYTSAIKAFDGSDDDKAVLYSNRCASLLKLSKLSKALADADTCMQLRHTWDKGYFRKGSVLEAMENYDQALEVYKAGIQLNPDSSEMVSKAKRLETYMKKLSRSEKKT